MIETSTQLLRLSLRTIAGEDLLVRSIVISAVDAGRRYITPIDPARGAVLTDTDRHLAHRSRPATAAIKWNANDGDALTDQQEAILVLGDGRAKRTVAPVA